MHFEHFDNINDAIHIDREKQLKKIVIEKQLKE